MKNLSLNTTTIFALLKRLIENKKKAFFVT
jgi:hypothetical protein